MLSLIIFSCPSNKGILETAPLSSRHSALQTLSSPRRPIISASLCCMDAFSHATCEGKSLYDSTCCFMSESRTNDSSRFSRVSILLGSDLHGGWGLLHVLGPASG